MFRRGQKQVLICVFLCLLLGCMGCGQNDQAEKNRLLAEKDERITKLERELAALETEHENTVALLDEKTQLLDELENEADFPQTGTLGEPFVVSSWEITINSMEYAESFVYDDGDSEIFPFENEYLLVVNATVKNLGDSSEEFCSNALPSGAYTKYVWITYEGINEFNRSPILTHEKIDGKPTGPLTFVDWSLESKLVHPFQERSGTLMFQIPAKSLKDEKPLCIQFNIDGEVFDFVIDKGDVTLLIQ